MKISGICLAAFALCLSAGAVVPLSEGDRLFAKKKWEKAARAYEACATDAAGREYWLAVVRSAASWEKAGDRSRALATANRVLKEAKGRHENMAVGEAFLLKQRALFRAKEKSGPRRTLVKAAVSRLGWTAEVSRLHENEANHLLLEGKLDSAWGFLSERRLVLSTSGTNVLAVLSILRERKPPIGKKADELSDAIQRIHRDHSAVAEALIDLTKTRLDSEGRIRLLCEAAEWAVAARKWGRVVACYDEAISECSDRQSRQRLRLRYADVLEKAGEPAKARMVYADWFADIHAGDASDAGIRRYVRLLTARRHFRVILEVMATDAARTAYSDGERLKIVRRANARIAAGEDAGTESDGKRMFARARTQIERKKYGDAMKLLKAVAARFSGPLRDDAILTLGDCHREEGRYQAACDAWERLAKETANRDVRFVCLLRLADVRLVDLNDVVGAQGFYERAAALIDANELGRRSAVKEGLAMCQAADGKVRDARVYFASRLAQARKGLNGDVIKWQALLDVCDKVKTLADGDFAVSRNLVIAELLFAAERYGDALRLFLRCQDDRRFPVRHKAYLVMQRARCLARMGAHEDALRLYMTFLGRYRDAECAPDALLRAGVLCVGAMGDMDRGCSLFSAIEKTWPDSQKAEQAMFYRLTVRIWGAQWDTAAALRETFLQRYPLSDKLDVVRNEYGRLIAARGNGPKDS